MSDASATLTIGSIIWAVGGAGLIAALASGWTLFAPFAAVVILLGIAMSLHGFVNLLRG